MKAIKRGRKYRGVGLVELIVTMFLLTIASVGALTYQYHAVRRSALTKAEIAAAQLGRLMIEDWKSLGGETEYDPSDLDLDIESAAREESVYTTTLNGIPMWITLWHQDRDVDTTAGITLREIRVTIQWKNDHSDGRPSLDLDPSYITATYVRRDEAGG